VFSKQYVLGRLGGRTLEMMEKLDLNHTNTLWQGVQLNKEKVFELEQAV